MPQKYKRTTNKQNQHLTCLGSCVRQSSLRVLQDLRVRLLVYRQSSAENAPPPPRLARAVLQTPLEGAFLEHAAKASRESMAPPLTLPATPARACPRASPPDAPIEAIGATSSTTVPRHPAVAQRFFFWGLLPAPAQQDAWWPESFDDATSWATPTAGVGAETSGATLPRVSFGSSLLYLRPMLDARWRTCRTRGARETDLDDAPSQLAGIPAPKTGGTRVATKWQKALRTARQNAGVRQIAHTMRARRPSRKYGRRGKK